MVIFYILLIISVLSPPPVQNLKIRITRALSVNCNTTKFLGRTKVGRFSDSRVNEGDLVSGGDTEFDYLERSQTNSVKGVFIFVVFFSHLMAYLLRDGYEPNIFDSIVFFINSRLGQLMVVMFLFYSGYGVAESINKKGLKYIRSIPKHRILPTIVKFDFAVCTFLIIGLLIGQDISLKQFLLALTTWTSIGNSNWYIFCIIYCYLATYISAIVARRILFKYDSILLLILLFIYIAILNVLRPSESWWFDTILAYGFGYFYSNQRNNIERFVQRIGYSTSVVCCVILIALTGFYKLEWMSLGFNLRAVIFAMLVVLISMKIRFSSKILIWMGINLFPLYIYQRLPMLALSTVNDGAFMLNNPYFYTVLCLVITTGIAFLVRKIDLYSRIGRILAA